MIMQSSRIQLESQKARRNTGKDALTAILFVCMYTNQDDFFTNNYKCTIKFQTSFGKKLKSTRRIECFSEGKPQ